MNILVNCHGAFYLGLLSQVCRCLNALKDLSQLLTGMVSTVCMIAFSDGKISVSYNLYTQDMSEVASLCLARTSSSGLRLICHVCLVWACPLEMFSCLLPSLPCSLTFCCLGFPILLQRRHSISAVAIWTILNRQTHRSNMHAT